MGPRCLQFRLVDMPGRQAWQCRGWLKAQPAPLVTVVANVAQPRAMMKIPVDGLLKALLETIVGDPVELGLDPGWIQSVAPVMTRPVGHETDAVLTPRQVWVLRLEGRADGSHNVEIGLQGSGADHVSALWCLAIQERNQRPRKIPDVNPVPNLSPVAVEGQLFAMEGFGNHQRDELFGKLSWAIIICAMSDDCRKIKSDPGGSHQLICAGLGRGVGRTGRIGP